MNYILTMSELRTLAALLGAQQLLGFAGLPLALEREEALRGVFSLTQRQLLIPEGESFRCEEGIRRLAERLAAPTACVLFTDCTGMQPQMFCYFQAEQATVVSPVPERDAEYRVFALRRKALLKLLFSDYLPPRDTEPGSELELSPDLLSSAGDALYTLPSLGLCTEQLSTELGGRMSCAGVFGVCGEATICTGDGTVMPYSRENYSRWLLTQIGGDYDPG